MMIEIPGYKTLDLKYLVLDYNGTIAVDGAIPETVKERLKDLSKEFDIYVLTADTHGTAKQMCDGLPVKIMTFPSDAAMHDAGKTRGFGRILFLIPHSMMQEALH